MKKDKFTIEIEPGTHKIIIRDSSGVEKELNSCLVSGGCPEGGDVFLFGWGHPRDVAASLAEGLSRSQGYEEREWWLSFIECLGKEMAVRTISSGEKLTLEKINKWTDPDQSRWAGYDSEDVLIDKKKSEDRKKAEEGFDKEAKDKGKETVH
jgi:hypothetical protein